MKRHVLDSLLVVTLFLVFASPASAEFDDSCDIGDSIPGKVAGRGLCILGGLFTSILVHEGGHKLAGAITGHQTAMEWDRVRTGAEEDSADHRFITASGAGVQYLTNEILLLAKKNVPFDHPFVGGFFIANALGGPAIAASHLAGQREIDPEPFRGSGKIVMMGAFALMSAQQLYRGWTGTGLPVLFYSTSRATLLMLTFQW